MLSSLFAVPTMVFATLQASPQDCDADCLTILGVAVEWAIVDAVENTRASADAVYLDLDVESMPGTGDGHATRDVASVVAERLGLPLVERKKHGLWNACEASPNALQCANNQGTTYAGVTGLRFLSEAEALVHTQVRVIWVEDREVGFSDISSTQLLMSRSSEGEWEVTEVRLRVVS